MPLRASAIRTRYEAPLRQYVYRVSIAAPLAGEPAPSDDSAPDLIALDGFEQRAEVAFAEALVALALNDLEENRPDDVLRENLQQHALVLLWVTVDQDAAAAQLVEAFAMAG